ncbi:MAG TPA: phage portal protein [Desulfitobacterium dehalogenans]|uniref:Phage portal protein n=1 Tax=Desulfitobacterium dehalogenans TaxID=36854 RepID=A0A7C6Z665_9FIRM|nr:phage portal protein [Desulfitobacterium dehalogenans]
MGIISWVQKRLGLGYTPLGGWSEFADEYADLVADVYFREMAFWSAVNIVANAVSKCEFRTFVNGEEKKGAEYYLWNVEPNKNQNSSMFLHKLVAKLYRKNECLVIEQGGQLLVADSFIRTPYALYDDVFTQVTVGDFTFQRSFKQSEVMYFKLSECNMRDVTARLYDSYSKLIAYSMKAYQKSRGTKGIFKYDTLPVADTEERALFDSLINDKIKNWLSGDNAALPLGRGLEWKELQHKTYSNENTRDIRAQIDDICDFTARGIGIPPALIRGDVQDTSKAVDQLLTFCVDPLCDQLQEEANRKRSGLSGFLSGTYLHIDTKSIKHVDLLSVATAIDKVIGSGSFCINDIRKACNEPIIDEPWAWQHFMTKNYADVDSLLTELKGGIEGGL